MEVFISMHTHITCYVKILFAPHKSPHPPLPTIHLEFTFRESFDGRLNNKIFVGIVAFRAAGFVHIASGGGLTVSGKGMLYLN